MPVSSPIMQHRVPHVSTYGTIGYRANLHLQSHFESILELAYKEKEDEKETFERPFGAVFDIHAAANVRVCRHS